jgi:hypothetical protein
MTAAEVSYGRHGGAAADVDEDLLGAERLPADPHLLRPDETGVADMDGDARVLAQGLLDALVGDLDDRVLARLDRLHVHPHRALDHDAEVGRATRHVRRPGARDQRLGRDAAIVDAGAAEALALDHGDLLAGLGQAPRERGSGLAGADHDGIEALHHVLDLLLGWVASLRTRPR